MMGWDDDHFGLPDGIPADWDPEEDQDHEHHCAECEGKEICPLPQARDYRKLRGLPEPTSGQQANFDAVMESAFEHLPPPVRDLLMALKDKLESRGGPGASGYQLPPEVEEILSATAHGPPPPPVPQGERDHHLFVPNHRWHLSETEINITRSCTVSSIHLALENGHSIFEALRFGASHIREMIRDRDKKLVQQLEIFRRLGTWDAVQADALEQAAKEEASREGFTSSGDGITWTDN
jgi:hypothetical protein